MPAAKSPAENGFVLLPEQLPDQVAAVDMATVIEDVEADRWWFFLTNVSNPNPKPNPGAYLDLGPRTETPPIEELDAILKAHGLTSFFGGWRAVRGEPGERSRATRVTTIESAKKMEELAATRKADDAASSHRSAINATTGFAVAGAVALFVSVFDLPIGYYSFLRLAILVICVVLMVLTARANAAGWFAGLIPAAILWNPLAPIYMARSDWLLVDLAGGAFFVGLAIWSGRRLSSP